MAINSTSLHDQLLDLFKDPGDTIAACADAWGSAVQAGCASIVPPSLTVSAAAGVLKAQLAAAFATAYPASINAIELAFTTFGVTVGLGMAPTYTAVPPPGPVGFLDLASSFRDTHEEAAIDVTNLIVNWLHTGQATLTAPPNTLLNWT